MPAKNRGRRPPRPEGKLREPPPPPDFNAETPKFCLHFLRQGFDVHSLTPQRQAAFAKALQKLSASQWKDLVTAPRHGMGTEHIPRAQLKGGEPPSRFSDQDRFMVLRYDGKLPMVGTRIEDVFHVLWIEPEFGQLYDHE